MDEIDEDILFHISKGKTNAYQVWTARKKAFSYINTNKRIKHLFDDGIIEEIIVQEINIHGRKDYRISKKGKEAIRQHIRKLQEILSS